MECWSCKSNSGEKRISPGDPIYEGKYWLVEHIYPTSLKGWLVIVLKRHAEALHELSVDEFVELGLLQAKLTRLLFEVTKCEKEYFSCFAEANHFNHIHVHVFARPTDRDDLKGINSFSVLKTEEKDSLSREEIAVFCNLLKSHFAQIM